MYDIEFNKLALEVEKSGNPTKRLSFAKQPLLSVLNDHIIQYPAPTNLTYWWGYGSTAGICLVIQIATGIFLAMHYTPHVDLAFMSVEHIMRDVQGGWLLRYMHANGASFLFHCSYLTQSYSHIHSLSSLPC